MNEISDKNRKKASFRVGNISVVLCVLVLGPIHIANILARGVPDFFTLGMLGVVTGAGLFALIVSYRIVKNYENLALFVPGVFFAFISAVQSIQADICGWDEYYLPLCIACCVLSCLYNNYTQTLIFVLVENAILAIMALTGVHFMGTAADSKVLYILDPELYQGIPLSAFGIIISLFSSLFLLLAFGALYKKANDASERRDSFETLMATAPNFIAMVDELNIVTNISSNFAKLAHLENPDWAIGRPAIDLFPSIELKELAGNLLRKKIGVYEEMWEFWLNGEHRFFKALADDLPDEKGILINLIDMTHLAERDEIAAMKDSLNIGLFFMDKDFIIQDNYSKALPQILGINEIQNTRFLDVLTESVLPSELIAIEDYFNMLFAQQFDQDMLDDINPLNEFNYFSSETKERKILHVDFIPVERGHGEIMIMGSIYDMTAKVELQRKLAQEESLRQEEMRSLFELINVEPRVFNDFIEDADYEFKQIDGIFKNHDLTSHEALIETYKSVHAIKSNAVILGLATFGEKVHSLESEIKLMREKVDVPFDDMLHLTLAIEKLMQEKENFRITIEKINSFKNNTKLKSNDDVLIEALMRATDKASSDLNKKVKFVVDSLDAGIMEYGPRRLMKEVLMQLVRNSVVHGVEEPEVRIAKGKDETGSIHLSIKAENNMIHIRLKDDGGGINYDKIREKALKSGFFKTEAEAQDKNKLLSAIFSPGFSTAETEGVHGGRGIGLNLVRDRIKEIGGSLKVQSELDKGTAFHLYIPLSDELQEKQEKAAS
jgi:two-component system chemotaxis sensor kinase CheA